MPDPPRKPIVFTDLDGTLLDHHTYAYGPVVPVLEKLKGLGVPVVANTSKTRSEWLYLAEQIGNDDAFVVENGSAIYLPDGECVIFGERREEILGYLSGLRTSYDFESYSGWDVEDIAAATGLDLDSAKRSSEREFSEPLVWRGSQEDKVSFVNEVRTAGFATLQGGRFLHVLGRTDKGKAVNWFRGRSPDSSPVIALGDGTISRCYRRRTSASSSRHRQAGKSISNPITASYAAPSAGRRAGWRPWSPCSRPF